jgi:type IV secretory pathway component VirB8
VEQSYNRDDIEEQDVDLYTEYESATERDEDGSQSHASRHWTIWQIVLLLLLLVVIAAVVVYVVLPFIASLNPAPSASQLPTPVQA